MWCDSGKLQWCFKSECLTPESESVQKAILVNNTKNNLTNIFNKLIFFVLKGREMYIIDSGRVEITDSHGAVFATLHSTNCTGHASNIKF